MTPTPDSPASPTMTTADARSAALDEIRNLVQQIKNVAASVDLTIHDTTTLGMIQQAQDFRAFLPQKTPS